MIKVKQKQVVHLCFYLRGGKLKYSLQTTFWHFDPLQNEHFLVFLCIRAIHKYTLIVQSIRQLLGTISDPLGPSSVSLQLLLLLPPILCGFGLPSTDATHRASLKPMPLTCCAVFPLTPLRKYTQHPHSCNPEGPEKLTHQRPVGKGGYVLPPFLHYS